MSEIKFPSYLPPTWSRCEEGPVLPRGEEAHSPQPSGWGQSDLRPKKWSFGFSGSLLASKGTHVKGKIDILPAGCNRCCLNFETGVWVLLLDFPGNGLEDFCGGANEETSLVHMGKAEHLQKPTMSSNDTKKQSNANVLSILCRQTTALKKKKMIALHFQNCRG